MRHANFYVSIFLSALLFGCSGKTTERIHNEGAVKPVVDQNNQTPAQQTLAGKEGSVWTQLTNDIQKVLAEKKVDIQNLQTLLLTVEKTLLHEKSLSDNNYYQSLSFRDLLSQFNRGIVQLNDQNPDVLEKSGLLKRYVDVLMSGCQKDLSECKHLQKFKVDQLTAQILVIQAQVLDKAKLNDSNIHQFYQLLRASFDVQTGVRNYTAESLYFKNSVAYLSYLKKNNSEVWAKKSEERLKADVTLVLNKLNGQQSNNELSFEEKRKYCDFIALMEPLNSSDKVQMIEEKSRKALAKDYLLCQAGKASLKESLLASIKTEKEEQIKILAEKSKDPATAKSNVIINLGYNAVLESLKQDPKLVKAFNLNLNHTQDGGFFVIDKLYYQRIDLNQAQSLLNSIEIKSDLDFIKNIRYYAQNQTAHMINESLRIYALNFEQNFNRIGLKDNLYVEVIGQMNGLLFQPWYSHIRMLGEIEKLVQNRFDKKYRSGAGMDKNADFARIQSEILDLRSELSNIKNHINAVLSIPMDYALFYYMSQTQGTVKFQFNFIFDVLSFDMKADEIFGKNVLLNIHSRPFRLLSFVPVSSKDGDFFALNSLQYALKIGLFEKFPFNLTQKEETKTGLELFTAQLLKETMVANRSELETKLKDMKNMEADADLKFRAQQICLNPMDARFDLLQIDVVNMGFGVKDGLLSEKISKIYKSILDSIQRSNEKIYNVQQIRTLINQYLTSAAVSNKEVVIKLFDDQLDYANQILKEITKIMLDLDRMFVTESKNCITKYLKTEQFRRVRLLEEHAKHFKNVHAAMTILKEAKEKKAQTLEALDEIVAQQRDQDVATRMSETIRKLKENNLWKPVSEITDLTAEQVFEHNFKLLVQALNTVYAVHNSPALEQKYGYFVNDPKLSVKDSKIVDLKHVSFFDDQTYVDAAWDTTLRTISYLTSVVVAPQELTELYGEGFSRASYIGRNLIFPQTTVNDAERLTVWDSGKKTEPVQYSENQKTFVNNTLRAFAGENAKSVVSWFKGSDYLDLLRYRFEWLTQMSMSKPLVFGQQKDVDCKIDGLDRAKKGVSLNEVKSDTTCGVLKLTAKDIISGFLDLRRFYNNTPEERAIYDILGLVGKNPDNAIKAFKYANESSTNEWTYFDEMIRRVYINKNADGAYLQGVYYFTSFKERKDAALSSKDHLLGIDGQPITLMRESLRRDILPQIEWVFKLEKLIRKLEEEHGKDKSKRLEDIVFAKSIIDRSDETLVDKSWRVLHVRERSNGTPIYLRDKALGQDSAIEWYRGYIRSAAVLKTNCEMLPKPGDSDEMTYKSSNCSGQFDEWLQSVMSEL